MTQLLRSCLARNAKESAVAVSSLVPAPDTIKLKKHVSLVSASAVMIWHDEQWV